MTINLSTADNLRSPIAEAFRSLRTNIQFSCIDKQIKSLVITSSIPGEGKSTIAFNLAVTIAQTEKKVLLIDTDLRKPTIHSYIQAEDFSGLTNIIVQGINYREVLYSNINTKNLDVIISGPIPPNPSEILGSAKMRYLVERLEQEYDMIILDSPPVGMVTDAAVLSTITDGVIVVCLTGKTKREDLGKSIDSLKKVNANLLGVVMNKAIYRKNSIYNAYYTKGK
ncbi:MAG TPA: CpsD/CapB family tyrosine-protein kinase [Candidatus Nitrosocosmicus sp.]|nr:CpsD/CapB family tyrosine-protein kinase [Candidatus Nitrosocosmicus sp.]